MEKNVIKNNYDVFSMLNPKGNDSFGKINISERLELLSLLKKYYLEYRERINVSNKFTFGLELEFENANRKEIEDRLLELFPSGQWHVVDDGSLVMGGEINSPILRDRKRDWINLGNVCDIVSKNSSSFDHAGAHIHIGMQILGNNPKYWANFAKLWACYEPIIYRFLYGEYISPRAGIIEQACPIGRDVINDLDRIDDRSKMVLSSYVLKLLDKDKKRKRCVNLTNISDIDPVKYGRVEDKNTVEIRAANGTDDPVIWQNNVNFLIKLFLYAKSDNFDEKLINQRLSELKDMDVIFSYDRYLEIKDREDISVKDKFCYTNLSKYGYIYISQAIELSDMIFDNNLDKIYFLRQYLKDGRVSSDILVRSDSFTMNRSK